MSDTVLLSVDDGVATVTLNRPDRLNALTREMRSRYFDVLEQCGDREDVRVIVVTGAGRGFCAGADLDELQSIQNGTYEAVREDSRPQSLALSIPKPVIAAINGACAGLGFVHAMMCDVRFAAAGAKFTAAFSQRGLVAEHGVSWMLPRLIGPARALDVLLSSRIVLAGEAFEMGFVNRVLPGERLLEETMSYARALAQACSPSSMAAMKGQIYEDLERTLRDATDNANNLMITSFAQPDFVEGVASFLERRPPRFAPLQR